MQVTAIAPTSGAAAGATATRETLDYSAFLTLLVAQMKNQDPLNPQDPTQYMSQLASFSSVEQAVKSNAKLDQLLTSNVVLQAERLVGRSIAMEDGTFGEVAAVRIASDGAIALLADGREIVVGPGLIIA